MNGDRVKKIILWTIFIFLIYAIFTDPHGSADVVRSIWSVLRNGVRHIGDFFNDILQS